MPTTGATAAGGPYCAASTTTCTTSTACTPACTGTDKCCLPGLCSDETERLLQSDSCNLRDFLVEKEAVFETVRRLILSMCRTEVYGNIVSGDSSQSTHSAKCTTAAGSTGECIIEPTSGWATQ